MRYVFFERGGHVAVCKRFRAFAKSIGAFKTLREKIAERPKVARLLGAVNVWDWERDKLAVVSNLVAAGIERGIFSVVPYCDYLEGKMSQGFWRDDEGSVRATVTNIPEKVRLYNLGEKYRLPLWELVYHDCVVSTWHWSESSNRQPELWRKRDLFNVLYGTVPMFTLAAGE